VIYYEGTVQHFREFVLPLLCEAARKGWNLNNPTHCRRIQRWLRNEMIADLRQQILTAYREAV
jgi:hypothetical protein